MRQNYILHNPASELELPAWASACPTSSPLPRPSGCWPSPTSHDPVGLRDRAMLETFYSTGMRRMELIHLKLYDLDRERGTLTIRQGKGKKDRMIPIGERALAWIDKYLRRGPPHAGRRAG